MNKGRICFTAENPHAVRGHAHRWAVPFLTILLSACTSDSPSGGSPTNDGLMQDTVEKAGLTVNYPTGTVLNDNESPWLAYIDMFQIATRPDTTGDILTELVRYDQDFAFADHVDFYENRVDVCNIRDLDAPDNGGGNSNTMVSGGANLILSSAGSTWLTVPYSDTNANYNGDDTFPAAMPSDLTITLPGDVFPSLSLALNVPSVPQRISPLIGDAITSNTEYRWVSDDKSSQMRISFLSYIKGVFQGFPIACYVQDDGEFELPADAIAEVERRAGELRVRYTRDTRQLQFRDGVAVFSTVSIADD